MKGTPPGDALPPPPQRATPARKGARCGASAGSPRPHRPHPGHTGRGTLAARSRGRAVGGGTEPDTRRPSQRWQATPPGDGPPPTPRHAAPTEHAGQGDSVRPPQPHTRAHSTWVADPNSPPSGRAVGAGTAPDLTCPSQWWKAPPPGTPFRHPHSRQRRPPRMHAMGMVPGPHARNHRTRNRRVAEPWRPAPEDGRPREGQRQTPDAPHNGRRPLPPRTAPSTPPRHAAPTGHAGQGNSVRPPHPHTRAYSTWVADPNSPFSGRAVGGGTAPDLRRPSQWWKATPPGDALLPPPQRATPARKGTRCGAIAGSPRPHRPHPGHTGRGTLAARSRGRAVWGGTAPDTRRPSKRWQATPPGDGSPPTPRHAAPTGHAGQGDSVGPPHPHSRAHSTWVADPNSLPSGRAVGGGTAPDLRRPSQWWKAPPPGTPFRHPHSEQRRPPRTHAVGPVLGPHTRTDGTRDTGFAEPRLPAPEDGRPGEGQRLTPDAPHSGGRPPPPGAGPPPAPWHAAPTGHAGQGDSVGPLHPHTRAHSTWVADPNSLPSGRAVGEGGVSDLRRPSQRWKAPPPGDALPPPPQRATPARKGARCGAGAGSPRPHRPHQEHRGRGTPAVRPRGWAVGGGTAPDTRRPSQRWQATPPRGRPPTTPAARSPYRACRPRGQCWAPTPTRPGPQHVGSGPQRPA